MNWQNKLKFSVLVSFTILYRTGYKKIDVRLVQCPFKNKTKQNKTKTNKQTNKQTKQNKTKNKIKQKQKTTTTTTTTTTKKQKKPQFFLEEVGRWCYYTCKRSASQRLPVSFEV